MNAKILLAVVVGLLSFQAQAKVKVVATLPSLGSLVRDVGGANVDVEVLAAATQDPHFVDARPNLVLKLNQAQLVVMNGLELEQGWLPPLLVQARNTNIQAGGAGSFDASSVVRNLIRPSGKIDRSMGDVHPGGNPHFLYDARAGADIARALGDKLAALDGANAATYKANASALAAKLDAFAQAQTARFAALPDAQRKVVTYHESYPYLLQWLKLDAVATVEPKPGVPPDPAHVAQVLTTMRGANVKVIVQEEYYPSSTSKTLTGMTHAKLVVLPGAARFSEGQSYLDHLTALTNAVFAGVSGAGVSGGAP